MKGKIKSIKKVLRYLLVISAFLLILCVSYFRLLDIYELSSVDFRFLLRPPIPVTDKVAIIEIGEDSIKKLGRFPFERNYHAILLKALSEFGARAVFFDILFAEPSEHDAEMEEAIDSGIPIYLPFAFEVDKQGKSNVTTASNYAAKCLESFTHGSKGTGHINIIPDIDGKFRRAPLYIKYGKTFYPHIAFLMASDYLGLDLKDDATFRPGRYISLKRYAKIPLDENSNILINFSGRWGSSYRHCSYIDVLQSYFARLSGQKPILEPKIFKDKVCIVGLTAIGTGDLHPSPFEPLYPGVGIHAEVFNSILNRRFIERLPRGTNLTILIMLGIILSFTSLKTKPLRGLSALILSIILFTVLTIFMFNYFGLWMDLIVPILVMGLIYLFFTLYKYLAEWKHRIVLENELTIAKKIQESFLPKKMPDVKGIDLSGAMFTARQVGGDLYDFLEFGPEKVGVMIGDVSGKGIPASLFMAMVSGSFKFFATKEAQPKDVLSGLNAKLIRESTSNLFVTMFYAIFDIASKRLIYSNSGHLPLIYLKRGGKVEFLDVAIGAPLGLIEGEYATGGMNFNEGDAFVFYTDGITEAMNRKTEMYDKERLASVIEINRGLSSNALVSSIEKDVRKFEPKEIQHDDMTILVIKIT